jgi:hypothetical protein
VKTWFSSLPIPEISAVPDHQALTIEPVAIILGLVFKLSQDGLDSRSDSGSTGVRGRYRVLEVSMISSSRRKRVTALFGCLALILFSVRAGAGESRGNDGQRSVKVYITQDFDAHGNVLAKANRDGEEEILYHTLTLPAAEEAKP